MSLTNDNINLLMHNFHFTVGSAYCWVTDSVDLTEINIDKPLKEVCPCVCTQTQLL